MNVEVKQETFWNTEYDNKFDNLLGELTYEEYEAILFYNNHGHKELNVSLHNNVEHATAPHLSTAIAKSEGFTGTVYRGATRKPPVTVGDTYSSNAFLSTSVDPHKAVKFMAKENVFYKITVKDAGLPISSDLNEDEVLFSNGSNFTVESIVENATMRIFYPETDYSVTYENVTFVELTQQ